VSVPLLSEDGRDALQEMVNVGMGTAGAALARVLNAFVELAVPSIDLVDRRRVVALLNAGSWADNQLEAARQPFFGRISGESLMLFDAEEAARLSDLVGGEGDRRRNPGSVEQSSTSPDATNDGAQHELLLDLANVVIGACVNGIADPLREVVSFAPPALLQGRPSVCEAALGDPKSWQRGLVINVDFKLEAKSFRSRVLVFLSEQSLALIDRAITRFLDELAAS
jgi:chemotaxis protein CheC